MNGIKKNTYWLLLTAFLILLGSVLMIGQTFSRYEDTALWNTVLFPAPSNAVISNCLLDDEQIILLGNMRVSDEGKTVTIDFSSFGSASAVLMCTNNSEFLFSELNTTEIYLDGDTAVVELYIAPTEAAWALESVTPVDIVVEMQSTVDETVLSGIFRVNLIPLPRVTTATTTASTASSLIPETSSVTANTENSDFTITTGGNENIPIETTAVITSVSTEFLPPETSAITSAQAAEPTPDETVAISTTAEEQDPEETTETVATKEIPATPVETTIFPTETAVPSEAFAHSTDMPVAESSEVASEYSAEDVFTDTESTPITTSQPNTIEYAEITTETVAATVEESQALPPEETSVGLTTEITSVLPLETEAPVSTDVTTDIFETTAATVGITNETTATAPPEDLPTSVTTASTEAPSVSTTAAEPQTPETTASVSIETTEKVPAATTVPTETSSALSTDTNTPTVEPIEIIVRPEKNTTHADGELEFVTPEVFSILTPTFLDLSLPQYCDQLRLNLKKGNLPAFTRYSYDGGETWYMLYYGGVIEFDLSWQESISLLLDFSYTNIKSGVPLSIVTAVYTGDGKRYCSLFESLPIGKSRTYSVQGKTAQFPVLIGAESDVLEFAIESCFKECEQNYTFEALLPVDDEYDAAFYQEVTEEYFFVELDGDGMNLLVSVGDILPPPGTYRLTVTYNYDGTYIDDSEMIFFVNYMEKARSES